MTPAISVVGMSCRYADARSPLELWENVLARRRGFRRLPEERLRLADYHSADRSAGDFTYGTEAAVLEGYEFDRVRFRIAGSTYRVTDLTHWLALEVAAEALADAGFEGDVDIPRLQTGVLVGNTLTGEFSRANLMRLRWPYVRRVVAAHLEEEDWEPARVGAFLRRLEETYKQPFPEFTEDSLAGGLANTIAGRICNHFDFKGGGYTVDGACASSLLAASQACSALVAGDLDLALVGGVDLSIDPFELVGFSRNGALTDGEMRVFDARSAGFIPGEGCGFLVLMRQDDAAAGGHRIYANIRGWGISSDGHGGMTRPEVDGQLLALERAYRRAGASIADVGYFEGHGTGTAVGDSTELSTLTRALGSAGVERPAVVGSVKANIGHTKAAAGVAGLIKATLALFHQVIPPNSGCERPHQILGQTEPAVLRVVDDGEPWPADRPLLAGVSGMGFGGINAHLVLEGTSRRRLRRLDAVSRRLVRSHQDTELLVLAAADDRDLRERLEHLEHLARRISRAELSDLAAVLAKQAAGRPRRAAVMVARPKDLVASLQVLRGWLDSGEDQRIDLEAGIFLGRAGSDPTCGFLFPGQGAPPNWGGGLWSRRFPELRDLVARPPAEGTGAMSAAIVGASLAGLRLLDDLGIDAQVAVGHSLGELSAMCWAGSWDNETVLRVAEARGCAMDDLGEPGGAMLSLRTSVAEAEKLIVDLPAVVAAINGSEEVVVSGKRSALETVRGRARAQRVAAALLPVPHGYHSPLVAPVAEHLAQVLEAEDLAPPEGRIYSTVTGEELSPGDLRDHLVRQIDRPVRFRRAFEAADPEVDLWIEVGSGCVLEQLLQRSGAKNVVALDVGSGSLSGLLRACGAIFALGARVDLEALFADRFCRPFDQDRMPVFLANPCESAPENTPLDEWIDPGPELNSQPSQAVAPTELEPLALVQQMVAERAELPPDSVRPEHRLLSDLHLSSLAVGQLVNDASRHLGLPPSVAATEYADATVAQVATALEEQVKMGPEAATREISENLSGIDAWVRSFTVELETQPRPTAESSPDLGPADWAVFGLPEHPLRDELASALERVPSGPGVLLCLPGDPGDEVVDLFLAAAEAVLARRARGLAETGEPSGRPPCRLVVAQENGGGGAFARTLHLEAPEIPVVVVDLPFDHPEVVDWVVSEARLGEGFAEVHYDADGVRSVPRLRLHEAVRGPGDGLSLGPSDVVLVSGGGKGIGAECALALVRDSGARLAVLGRSDPAEDPSLARNLERLTAAGVRWRYECADVTNQRAVATAVSRIESTLGTVTGILHAAGVNRPQLLSTLDREEFLSTLAPKVGGLQNLLGAVQPEGLRLLLTFGSIIARTGMKGEAHYAVANEWMTSATEAFGRRFPDCRCLALEWSVWAGVGMGDRLGRIEALARQGITPITIEQGVAALGNILSSAGSSSLVVSGRLGEVPTLTLAGSRMDLPLWRFLERPRVHYPGIELVVDADLSAGTDPYLNDHVFEGNLLLPGVIGLEAMCQAAMALAGVSSLPILDNVRFQRPVIVPEGGVVEIRLAALVRPGKSTTDQTVDVVLRCGETGFHHDHFSATCRFEPRSRSHDDSLPTSKPINGFLPLDPAVDLYGGVLFQTGRFRRLLGYRSLRARESLAEIAPNGVASWFGGFLPGKLLLGDPAARDAVIHSIQASIPHATVLPVAVEHLELGVIEPDQTWSVSARERYRKGRALVYDVEVRDTEGRVCEAWIGLELRIVDPAELPADWAIPLLGPYLERNLEELIPGSGVEVVVEASSSVDRRAASDHALQQLAGEPTAVRRPDGKPLVENGGPAEISVSHAEGMVLAVMAQGAVGCDMEAVVSRGQDDWKQLLPGSRFELGHEIGRMLQEDMDTVATRIWAASECLKKVGAGFEAPMVLGSRPKEGWLTLRSGSFLISTVVTRLRERSKPMVFAILGREDASHRSKEEI